MSQPPKPSQPTDHPEPQSSQAAPGASVSWVFHYRPAAWLRIFGPDAAEFLQGQFTNDVAAIPPGGAAYGLWLDAKGRVLADSFILRTGVPEEFRLLSYACPGEGIRSRLEAFIVADEVSVEDDSAGWAAVSLVPGQTPAPGLGLFFEGRRGVRGGGEWVYPVERQAEVRERLAGLAALDPAAVERLRIEAGVPSVPADIGPGDLPAEGALDAFVSATKGCFTGQEVVARLRSRGRLRRSLVRVRSAAPRPSLPAGLVRLDGTRAGEIRSAAAPIGDATKNAALAGPDSGDGFVGLALVLSDALAAGAPLFIGAAGEPPPAQPPVVVELLSAP